MFWKREPQKTVGAKGYEAFRSRYGSIYSASEARVFVDGYVCGRAQVPYEDAVVRFSYLGEGAPNGAGDGFARGYAEGLAVAISDQNK